MKNAQARFATLFPDGVIEALATPAKPERPCVYLGSGKLRQRWMDFVAVDSLAGQARLLRELFFPPAAYMRSRYGNSSLWLPLLYLRRAAGGVVKALSGMGSPSRLRSISERASKWKALPAADKKFVLFSAVVVLPAAWAALRFVGLGRIQHWLAARSSPSRPHAFKEAERLARLLDLAAKHTWTPTTCLTRSLALVWLLRRRGIEVQLRLGVRRAAGMLEAHAWTECGGAPVNDSERISERFEAFAQPLPYRSFLQ
jgi:hypothetical protein